MVEPAASGAPLGGLAPSAKAAEPRGAPDQAAMLTGRVAVAAAGARKSPRAERASLA